MPLLSQFDYNLPRNCIAQVPADPRDSSKLLKLNRSTGEITDSIFSDLPNLLPPHTLLVRNNTRVIPARIFGHKTTGGAVEILLIHQEKDTWECMTRPGLKAGQTVQFSGLEATCIEIRNQTRIMRFSKQGAELFSTLSEIGHTPIPPYISWDDKDPEELKKKYQTTYAKIAGSAAAPTAGLHFTPELDEKLRAAGFQIAEVTLHVGLGTFLRVKTEEITDHAMHFEWYSLDADTAKLLNQAKESNHPIIAVGTTTTRVLETVARHTQNSSTASQKTNPLFAPLEGETNLFVYPPSKMLSIDGMITNFHEPKSTLLMLVSAFCTQPNTHHEFKIFSETTIGKAYSHAIKNSYRLLSFGDAMLIV